MGARGRGKEALEGQWCPNRATELRNQESAPIMVSNGWNKGTGNLP